MVQLLVEAARRGVFRAYIERILAAIGATKTVPSKQEDAAISSIRTPFGESLSERELEVLRLIAQGASNREIAEQLVVTVGTVKSHVNHILGKLDSHNRTEAVAQARKLGLL
jgi:LuxR family maltose regulon positive regulatory protein